MAVKNWKDKYRHSCGGMLIDPFFEGDYIEAYPILGDIKCSVGEIHFDNFVRCCSFTLDPNSPIQKEFSDLKTRRDYVQSMLGYKGHQDRSFEVNMLKKVYRKTDWTLLCTIDNVFDEFATRANEELADTDELDADKMLKAVQLKRKYIDDMKDMIGIREDLYKKIFMDNENLMEIEREQALNPEAFVKLKKSSK